MGISKPNTPFLWQRAYARKLRRRLARRRTALVQLPTGSGKTLIVLSALTQLLKRRRMTVVICTPRRVSESDIERFKEARSGAKGVELHNPWLRDCVAFKAANLRERMPVFLSHSELHRMVSKRLRLRRWHSPVIVIDEVHRKPRLLHRFRRISPGRNARFVFVSATPVNPVRIDEPSRSNRANEEDQTTPEDVQISKGYLTLYRALLNLSQEDELLEELERFSPRKSTLEAVAQYLKKSVIPAIEPVPSAEQLLELHQPRVPRQVPRFRDAPDRRAAIAALVRYQERVHAGEVGISATVAERIACAGFGAKGVNGDRGNLRWHNQGSIGAYAADDYLNAPGVPPIRAAMDFKLRALQGFLEDHFSRSNSGRVLVFCSYRKTVHWVSRWLEAQRLPIGSSPINRRMRERIRTEFGALGQDRLIWDTESLSRTERASESELLRLFNLPLSKTGGRGAVLVTSDRCSESVDLHGACNTMVHFDLSWSPLRMIQRVGRLWRINAFKSRRGARSSGRIVVPNYPHVYHLVYPCSVDEEVSARLHERWERLGRLGLGLDLIPERLALGPSIGSNSRPRAPGI